MNKIEVSKSTDTSKGAYSPEPIESKWTDYWSEHSVFDLDIHADRPRYSIALPPPNITGNLHMGHALNGTLQDVLVRLKRMQGYSVLWQAGTDHAGIATQMVVERGLRNKGIERRKIGRESFLAEVWKWREQYGNQIMSQYKRLGVSFAWDRVVFTMDDAYVKAVYRAFVSLFKEGYIYRGHRVSNWCPGCLTTVSDLEVQHEETQGSLYLIDYKLLDGSGSLTIATTRPETLFGDTAVAVHPEDARFQKWIGSSVRLPLTDRDLPVIADAYVETGFGTGALKITPAHDANDWEVGQRHQLPAPQVIDENGNMLANQFVPTKYHGKDRFQVRAEVVADLESLGLLREIQAYTNSVGNCDRCQTVIEPMLSEQWYVKMKDLAEPAIASVQEGRISFFPERYAVTYLDWLANVRDWCISRQLWWGQRIPVWTCTSCGHIDAYEESPKACCKCNHESLVQDPDVLDTWFSSALWPFATLGWPSTTPEFKAFYPTTVLCTAREIINLWVSRMIFMSLKLLGTIPFKHVLIHPVIQTPDGKRMSKSKGNAVDPLEMITKYGADANRFWFASVGIKGDQDVRFREDRLEEYKRFVNKLWNAGRFVIYQLQDQPASRLEAANLTLADRWILNRFHQMLAQLQEAYNNYDFQVVAQQLYDFTWDHFCDWYLEISKEQFENEKEFEAKSGHSAQTRNVLYTIFEGLLRATHPVMPFVTEELWHQLPKSAFLSQLESIMFAPFPREDHQFIDPSADEDMSFIIRIVRSLRNIRQIYGITPNVNVQVYFNTADQREFDLIAGNKQYIKRLANCLMEESASLELPARAATDLINLTTLSMPLESVIDVEKTKDKLVARRTGVEKELSKTREILENKQFAAKAPQEKVDAIKQKLRDFEQQLKNLRSQLKVLD